MIRLFQSYLIGSLLCYCCLLTGQQMLDPWFHVGQDYMEFKVDSTGIYKITHAELLSSGYEFDEIIGSQLVLYSYGERQRIFTTSEGLWSAGDYLLFLGEKNDGRLDSSLYKDAIRQQLNPEYSLYTDDRTYYLTFEDHNSSTLRYIQTDDGLDGPGIPPRENYFLYKDYKVFNEFILKPSYNGRDFIRYSDYDTGEGYGSSLKNQHQIKIKLTDLSPFGIDPRIKLRLGSNVFSRSVQLLVDGIVLKNLSSQGYGVIEFDEQIDRDLISGDSITITVRSPGSIQEKTSIAYYELTYPRVYNLENKGSLAYTQQASILPRLIEVSHDNPREASFFNVTTGEVINPAYEDESYRFIVSASFIPQEWFFVNGQEEMLSVKASKLVQIEPQEAASYTIITHPLLMEAARRYADYRRSEEGGSFDVSVVDMTQLTKMYAYGIDHHPIGLKRFLTVAMQQDSSPEYVFLMGKGLEYADIRDKTDLNLIPTWGQPGSDNMLVATDGQNFPSIPIGRLATTSPQGIEDYLNKIVAHEGAVPADQTLEQQNWKKQIIHLSGGSADIQNLLFNYLNDMSDVIASRTFGGDIATFRKTSADPIQTAKSDEIITAINGGSSIISFFGHSAVGTFDFSLEDPSKYNNAGRNPIILSLGCHSGNIHTKNTGVSESFVLQKDVGATVFLASSGTAYINPQYHMGLDLYELIGEQMYGESIGKILMESLKMRADEDNMAIQTLLQQFTLHGDPAYSYNTFEGPDYVVDYNSVRIFPDIITANTKTITLDFEVVNLGRAEQKAMDVMVVHEYEAGIDTSWITISAPGYRTAISTDILNPGYGAVGQNSVQIIVDPQNQIDEKPAEQAEKNNELIDDFDQKGFDFFIIDKTASPVYPADYAIVSDPNVELIAGINNAFDFGGKFELQIDTTEEFNSPLLEATTISDQSSILRWKPNIDLVSNTVYYWRIAPVTDVLLKDNRWKMRSFVNLPDSDPGWNQSHYYQWTKNDYYKLRLDTEDRALHYDIREWDIRIKNKIKDPNDFWVFVNNSPWRSLNPKELAPGISVFAWHPEEVIVTNSGTDYGSLAFSPDGFVFKTDTPESRQGLINLLQDLPEGSRVFLHTLLEDEYTTLNIDQWSLDRDIYGTDLFEVLESYGSLRVSDMKERGAVPFTMIFDKGKGLVVEDMAETIEGTIDLSSKGVSTWNEGQLNSVTIGPVRRWKRLIWEEETQEEDVSKVNVYGLKSINGTKTLLKEAVGDYSVNLTSINPAEFPYINLEYNIADVNRTASALNHWRVLHSELPDAALYATEEAPFIVEDTINAGEDLILDFNIENLSTTDLEPILVRYRLIDSEGKSIIFVKRATGVPGNERINFVETIKTDHLGGAYRLNIELNPNEDQPELTMVNNFGQTSIYIRPDRSNPFLDVTFDGRTINNGTVIHPNPEIAIMLRDPNASLLLDSSEDFEITLLYPEVFQRTITKNDPDVTFIPATDLERNVATFLINPNLSIEGVYTLIVNARDKAGNWAGPSSYQIQFEVKKDQLESYFKAWPVPFTDELNFEFTLGERIPDVFYLSIFSVDGRLVKQVNIEDFNELRTGTNRYQWDGLDLNGESLTNGIYYYEVINNLQSRGDKWKGSVVRVDVRR